jgi:hypothetical protein
MTTRARSAKRSKPQRMSVASAANHIRAPWDPCSARKLGKPITPRSPTQPAGRVGDWSRTRAQPQGCILPLDESRSPYPLPMAIVRSPQPASVPEKQTSFLRLPPAASSSRRTAICVNCVHDKTTPRFDRSRVCPKTNPHHFAHASASGCLIHTK